MINEAKTIAKPDITNFEKFVKLADYSLMDTLRADPDSTRVRSFRVILCPLPLLLLKRRNMFPIAVSFLQN